MSSTTTAGRTAGLNGSTVTSSVRKPAEPMRLQAGRPKPPAAAVALCLLLMLGCGAAAGAAVLGADSTTPVIVASRPLAAGTVIGREDLKVADLAGSGLSAIEASNGGTLLGKTVLGPIPAGTLLNAGMVGGNPPPAAGQVAVGLALTPGQLPATHLAPGRLVRLYALPPKGPQGAGTSGTANAAPATRVLVDRAEVLSVTSTGNGGTLVNVVVAQDAAPEVAAASYAGLVGVGLLPVGDS